VCTWKDFVYLLSVSAFHSLVPFPPLTCILPCRCPSSRQSNTTSPTRLARAACSSRDPTACHWEEGGIEEEGRWGVRVSDNVSERLLE